MVKRIVGLDAEGKEVFNREARGYDQGISSKTFGITIGDVLKIVPVFILIITVYVNQQNFNIRVLELSSNNAQAIGSLKEVVLNLNNYLSSQTGKQFKDGRPLYE